MIKPIDVGVTRDQIEEAWNVWARIHQIGTQRGGKERFKSGSRWTGQLGESAVKEALPFLIWTHQPDKLAKVSNFDFYTPVSKLKVEAKTKNGSNPWKPTYQGDVNKDQFVDPKLDPAIYIYCYFQLKQPGLEQTPVADTLYLISVVGWLWKREVTELGRFLEAGKTHPGSGETVIADRWEVDYYKMNDLADLPT